MFSRFFDWLISKLAVGFALFKEPIVGERTKAAVNIALNDGNAFRTAIPALR